ncbi:MAG: hypothetical protein QOF82_2935, partial [Frankiales bacterium]|nr:hypothetical protein [Frankiales bacterium]
PLLADVLAAGKIGVEHLQAVAGGAARVPAAVLAGHDHTLRNLAPHARPSEMRRAAAKIQACHDEESVAAVARHVHDSRYLSLARTFGGAYHLDGLLDPEAGASLVTALDALMAPRGAEDTRTPAQRRADALTELTGLGLASGKLPDLGGTAPGSPSWSASPAPRAPRTRTIQPQPQAQPRARARPGQRQAWPGRGQAARTCCAACCPTWPGRPPAPGPAAAWLPPPWTAGSG